MSAAAINDLIESKGYITSETDNQTLSWNGVTGEISISNGNTIDIDGRYLQDVAFTDIQAGSVIVVADGFTDVDNQLMSAAAINDLIESKGYITTGDISTWGGISIGVNTGTWGTSSVIPDSYSDNLEFIEGDSVVIETDPSTDKIRWSVDFSGLSDIGTPDAADKLVIVDTTDGSTKYVDWSDVGAGTIGGSIASNQVAVGSGTNTISGSSELTFDGQVFKVLDSGSNSRIRVTRDASGAALQVGFSSAVGSTAYIWTSSNDLTMDISATVNTTTGDWVFNKEVTLAKDLAFNATSGTIVLPDAPTTVTTGALKYNQTTNKLQVWDVTWNDVGAGGGDAWSDTVDSNISGANFDLLDFGALYLRERATADTIQTNQGQIWAKDDGTLHYEDPDGTTDYNLTYPYMFSFVIGGGGSSIVADATNGVTGTQYQVPFDCVIVGWDIISDVSTTTDVELWRNASAIPTGADEISDSAGGNYIELTASLKTVSTTLTNWTTSLSQGDVLKLAVAANDNATQLTIKLHVRPT